MKKGIIIFGGLDNNYDIISELCQEIKNYLVPLRINHIAYDSNGTYVFAKDNKSIIYCEEDGKRLQKAINLCQKKGLNLVNLSKGSMNNVKFPKKMNFCFTNAEIITNKSTVQSDMKIIAERSVNIINQMKNLENKIYYLSDNLSDLREL